MTAVGPANLNSVGTAINASGEVAGYLWNCCYTAHAFLYSSGIFADLGTLPGDIDSYAEGMNDAGQVTGNSDSSTASRAFLYSNGVMVDLNSLINPGLGITLTDAGAINNSGQIAATGIDAAGRQEAFLLTPAPEPSTFLLFGGALCVLARKRISGATSLLARARQLF
jgi:probable HAF family extracellular repeat protein